MTEDVAFSDSSNSVLRPWIGAQTQLLLRQRGHAWLLHGPSGLGQYSLALSLVRAWLCEKPEEGGGSCGTCVSCHAIEVHTHADLAVLMPETTMLSLGWPLSEKAQSELDDKKRKPSKEIRIEAMRELIQFSQRSSSRGRGKAVLVFPAEQMNAVTANALLKTLEEPPGAVKFVLASESAHQLLPTIRSRCLGHPLQWPSERESISWLESQGVGHDSAVQSLKAAGGRPEDALDFVRSGRDVAVWSQLRAALSRGDIGIFKDWTNAQVLDAMLKLCHDLLSTNSNSSPRFIDRQSLGGPVSVKVLAVWYRSLVDASKTVEHPFNGGLMLEALVSQAKNVLNSTNN